MRLARSASVLVSILTMLAGVSGSQSPPASEFVNPMPVDAMILTYTPAGRGFSTVRVPANGRHATVGSSVLAMEPVSSEVGRKAFFQSCATGSVIDSATLQKAADDLRRLEFLETDSARERLEVAATLAQLELAQKRDEKDTFRNDPLRLELQRQQERYDVEKSVQQAMADSAAQRNQAIGDVVSDATDLALAWSSVQQEKLAILYDQYKTLAPLVEQARMALTIKQDEFGALQKTVAAWHAYSAAVADALDRSTSSPSTEIIVEAKARKLCEGPSGASDSIEVAGPASLAVSALVTDASFDTGPRQRTFLRRLARSNLWTGRIDWPVGATRARLRVRWPGSTRWRDVAGQLATDRVATAASFAEARRAVSHIEKKLKDTNFRAVGGDHLRTTPIF